MFGFLRPSVKGDESGERSYPTWEQSSQPLSDSVSCFDNWSSDEEALSSKPVPKPRSKTPFNAVTSGHSVSPTSIAWPLSSSGLSVMPLKHPQPCKFYSHKQNPEKV